MKLIIAYIQPERLTTVKNALAEVGIKRMSVTNSLGCGRQQGFTESWRGAESDIQLLKKVRLEIGVRADEVDLATDAIIASARSGKPGDGMIFVVDLGRAIRIRTGETDDAALGKPAPEPAAVESDASDNTDAADGG